MTRSSATPRFTLESFDYPAASSLPTLILGFHIPYQTLCNELRGIKSPVLSPNFTWEYLAHECGGKQKQQRYWVGTRLIPTVVAKEGIRQIAAKWKRSGLGAKETTLTQIRHYDEDLKRYLGAGCDEAYALAAEGHYTLDMRHLRKLTTTKLPQDLDELANWRDEVPLEWRAVVLTN